MSIKDNISINAKIFCNEMIERFNGLDKKGKETVYAIIAALFTFVFVFGCLAATDEPPANDPSYAGGTYEATAEVVDNDGGYVIDGHLFRDSKFEGYQVGALVDVTMNDGGTINNYDDDELAHIGE